MKTQRVILIGDTQVGKTCLCTRLIDKEYGEGQSSTVSPMFSPYSVSSSSGVTVNMEVWDTAGQERFASISKTFYRDADFAIVCYESTNANPIDTVQKWIQRVHEEAPQCKIFIAVTKSDIIPPENQLKCMDNALDLSNRVGAVSAFMTSSLSGIGVDDLFTGIADEATSANAPVVVQPEKAPVQIQQSQPPTQKKCC